jgi:hypothetical protein
MKTIFYSIGMLLILSLGNLKAQTTVLDFTKSDCNGIQTNLYQQLDSGYTVILEYVMLPNCSPCITAAKGLKSILQSGNISQPEKVKMFQISFDNSTTCGTLQTWASSNGFTYPLFENGANEVDYYGGMGMPTIVIASGKSHGIYYQKQGYSPTHNNAITLAINNALSQVNGIEQFAFTDFKMYPQPANNQLSIETETELSSVSILDMTGKTVFQSNVQGKSIDIALNKIPSGIYFVRCKDKFNRQLVKKLIVE